MTRLTVFDVSKALQIDGGQLVQMLRQLGIFNAAYEPKGCYVATGYFECVIEPNPAAPGYGMLNVFVTPRGLIFVQYLVLVWLFMRYQHEYAVGLKIETGGANRPEQSKG